MPFIQYAAAGFGPELLPILPPQASISPATKHYEDLLKSRGKVPGKLGKDGWFGFKDWTSYEASPQDHTKWGLWRCGVGLQGRKFPAVDIDVDDGEVADAIEQCALLALGLAPSRSRGGGRRLLVYAAEGFARRRLAFSLPGGCAQPAAERLRGAEGGGDRPEADDLDPGRAPVAKSQAVELLGAGQQYLVEGIHPSGQPYVWRNGVTPATVTAAELTPVSIEEVDHFFELAREVVEGFGYEIVGASQGSLGDRGGVWQGGLQAPSLDAAYAALNAIPNDVDYPTYIKIMAAFKAATEGL
jgi:hypothetical protein